MLQRVRSSGGGDDTDDVDDSLDVDEDDGGVFAAADSLLPFLHPPQLQQDAESGHYCVGALRFQFLDIGGDPVVESVNAEQADAESANNILQSLPTTFIPRGSAMVILLLDQIVDLCTSSSRPMSSGDSAAEDEQSGTNLEKARAHFASKRDGRERLFNWHEEYSKKQIEKRFPELFSGSKKEPGGRFELFRTARMQGEKIKKMVDKLLPSDHFVNVHFEFRRDAGSSGMQPPPVPITFSDTAQPKANSDATATAPGAAAPASAPTDHEKSASSTSREEGMKKKNSAFSGLKLPLAEMVLWQYLLPLAERLGSGRRADEAFNTLPGWLREKAKTEVVKCEQKRKALALAKRNEFVERVERECPQLCKMFSGERREAAIDAMEFVLRGAHGQRKIEAWERDTVLHCNDYAPWRGGDVEEALGNCSVWILPAATESAQQQLPPRPADTRPERVSPEVFATAKSLFPFLHGPHMLRDAESGHYCLGTIRIQFVESINSSFAERTTRSDLDVETLDIGSIKRSRDESSCGEENSASSVDKEDTETAGAKRLKEEPLD